MPTKETTQTNKYAEAERPPNGERLRCKTCLCLNVVGCRQSSAVKTYSEGVNLAFFTARQLKNGCHRNHGGEE